MVVDFSDNILFLYFSTVCFAGAIFVFKNKDYQSGRCVFYRFGDSDYLLDDFVSKKSEIEYEEYKEKEIDVQNESSDL